MNTKNINIKILIIIQSVAQTHGQNRHHDKINKTKKNN